MGKFLLRILLFIVPVVIVVTVAESYARGYPTSYRQKDEYIRNHGTEITTLVLGASYAYDGFDAAVIPGAYNFANNSQTLEIDLALLQHYKKELPNLKRVVLAIGYMTMVDPPLEDTDEWYRVGQYQIQMGLPLHPKMSRYNWEFADLYHFGEKLRGRLRGETPDLADSSGLAMSNDNHPSEEALKRRGPVDARKHTMSGTHTYEGNLAALEKLMAYCKEQKLEVWIISYPVTPEYQNAKDPTQEELRVQTCRRMVDEWRCHWVDMTTDRRFSYTDFSDPSHLNRQGANHLVRILASEKDF